MKAMLQRVALRRLKNAFEQGNSAFQDHDLATARNAFITAVSIASKKERDDNEFAEIGLAARIGLGRVSLAEKEPLTAARWFAEVQQIHPGDWRGHYWSGCAAAHGNSFASADRHLSVALSRGAPEVRALVERAQVRVKLGQHAAALADLQDASGKGPLPDRIWQLGAALALREARPDLASWFAAASAAPLAAAVSGTAALGKGDPEAALEAYERALAGGLELPEVYLERGVAAYQLGRFDLCRDSWSSAGAGTRALEGVRYARAMQLLGDGEFDAACSDLEAIAGHGYDAPLSDLRLHAAAAAAAAGALDDAARHLEGTRSDGFIGLVEYARNRPGPAERSWHRSPEDPLARLCLALRGVEQGEDPLETLLACRDAAPPGAMRTAAAQALAVVHVRNRDWGAACDAFADAADAVPRTDPAYGESLYRSGRHGELLGLSENPWHAVALLESDPNRPGVPGSGGAGRAAALRLRQYAYDAAGNGDWEAAAALRSRVTDAHIANPTIGDALVLGFGGARSAAAAALDALGPPDDTRLAYTRALMLLHGLADPDGSGRDIAERSIAAWAPILQDRRAWLRWGREAERRYGHPVPGSSLEETRASLRRLIESSAVRAGATNGPDLMQRELDGAAALRALGGIPLDSGGRIVCGPLRAAELGLHDALAQMARDSLHFELLGLPVIFSAVGTARVALRLGRPADALRAALDLSCDDCRDDEPVEDLPRLCRPGCPGLDGRNPGFAHLDDREKRRRLRSTAASVACDALLELARVAVARTDGGIAEANDHWRRALPLASACRRRQKVERSMVDVALGRAAALRRGDQLDSIIALLEPVSARVSGSELRDRVQVQLSGAVRGRGVRTANAGDLAGSLADLEWAARLTPHLVDVRRDLGVVLMRLAEDGIVELAEQGRPLESEAIIDFLNRSLREFEAALEILPADPKLQEFQARTDHLLRNLLRLQAVQRMKDRQREAARSRMERELRPVDIESRLKLGATLRRLALARLDAMTSLSLTVVEAVDVELRAALRHVDAALRFDPRHPKALTMRQDILRDIELIDTMLRFLRGL